LVCGAGGAARGVVYALKKAGAKIFIANRTYKNAARLAKKFNVEVLRENEISNFISNADFIVNASACGMKVSDVLPFKCEKLKSAAVIYDLIYNKETPFKKLAEKFKAEYFSGLGMLIRQGAYSFKIWTGKFPGLKSAEKLLAGLK